MDLSKGFRIDRRKLPGMSVQQLVDWLVANVPYINEDNSLILPRRRSSIWEDSYFFIYPSGRISYALFSDKAHYQNHGLPEIDYSLFKQKKRRVM